MLQCYQTKLGSLFFGTTEVVVVPSFLDRKLLVLKPSYFEESKHNLKALIKIISIYINMIMNSNRSLLFDFYLETEKEKS